MNQGVVDKITTGVAGASLASPIWLPWLKTVSEVAALLLPILGLTWLLIQMVGWFRGRK
jgi:hypothetical protein